MLVIQGLTSLAWEFDICLINVCDLTYVRRRRHLFNPVSFTVHPREMILITGANGAGKSTLLRILAGITTPSTGIIKWQGRPLTDALTDYTNSIHYLGHQNGLMLRLTVMENIQLSAHYQQQNCHNLALWLEQLNLNHLWDQQVQYLSAGQKRRVGLLKCFLFPKPILILDEPLTSLDQPTQVIVRQAFDQHLSNDGIIILSSHDGHSFKTASQIEVVPC